MKEIIDGKEYLVEKGIYTSVVKETPYEEMGGTYKIEVIEEEVEILVPNLEEPEEENWNNLNLWGRARKKFLEEEKPQIYQRLLTQNELYSHLMEIQEEVEKFWEMEMPKMKKSWGLTEELKEKNQMEWVGLMNNLQASLREIIYNQIIYK